MKSTLDVVLAILGELGVGDYYLTSDTGNSCLVELAHPEDSDFRPIKILCGFYGPLWGDQLSSTSLLIHWCETKECCDHLKQWVLPEGNCTHGVLEDPAFYSFLTEIVYRWGLYYYGDKS